MSARRIVRRSARDPRRRGRTDWARIEALDDRAIDRAIGADPDAAPRLDPGWFRAAAMHVPAPKEPVSLRVDRDVLAWFRASGPGYQTRMNAALRAFMDALRRAD